MSAERIERLKQQNAFAALAESKKRKEQAEIEQEIAQGRAEQQAIIDVLHSMDAAPLYQNRAEFTPLLDAAFKQAGIKLAAPVRKAILTALSERDESAAVCRVGDKADGAIEPDSELRDTENVLLPQDLAQAPFPLPLAYGPKADNSAIVALFKAHCDAYFEREAKPHVPDAWIDYAKTRIGFEIPFNRHFYQYQPPRPLEEIDAELKALTQEIMKMMLQLT